MSYLRKISHTYFCRFKMENKMELTAIDFNTATQLYNYKEFKALVNSLMAEEKVTGNTQTESLLETTKMNMHRMLRIEKTAKLNDDLLKALNNVNTKMTWYVITEGWCGDGSQNLPVLAKMAESNPNITLKFLLRDENPEIMDAYLTNGGKSVPKLICINDNTGEELGTWGPRPQKIQDKVVAFKKENVDAPKSIFGKNLHLWYAKDKTQALQEEFVEMLNAWVGLEY